MGRSKENVKFFDILFKVCNMTMYIDKEEQRYIEFKGKRSRHLNYLPNTPRPYLKETYITSDTSTP